MGKFDMLHSFFDGGNVSRFSWLFAIGICSGGPGRLEPASGSLSLAENEHLAIREIASGTEKVGVALVDRTRIAVESECRQSRERVSLGVAVQDGIVGRLSKHFLSAATARMFKEISHLFELDPTQFDVVVDEIVASVTAHPFVRRGVSWCAGGAGRTGFRSALGDSVLDKLLMVIVERIRSGTEELGVKAVFETVVVGAEINVGGIDLARQV